LTRTHFTQTCKVSECESLRCLEVLCDKLQRQYRPTGT